MPTFINEPTEADQKEAKKSVTTLERITVNTEVDSFLEFQIEGTSVSLPRKAVLLLQKILEAMAGGKSVEITSFSPELSTQEAADLLKVSRPHVVKLLEAGKIPHKKVGKHRRVLLEDIKKYDLELRETRRKNLDELTKEAQEMGLGY